jgi:hypothetical protein
MVRILRLRTRKDIDNFIANGEYDIGLRNQVKELVEGNAGWSENDEIQVTLNEDGITGRAEHLPIHDK